MNRLAECIPDCYLRQNLSPAEVDLWYAGEPPRVERDEGDSVLFVKTCAGGAVRLSVPKRILDGELKRLCD